MKMSVKRAAAALLASAMMLSLTACGGGGETETSAAGGETSAAAGTEAAGASEGAAENASAEGEKVVKIAYTSDPGSLGTFDEGSSSGRWTVLAYTYENLLYMGSDGEYYGLLAKNWGKNEEESTPDAVVWDVEIYDYITDTNGNNITADDVVFSFNECLENGKGNQHTALTGALVSIEKSGDYSVKITVNSEAAGEIENMMQQVMIVSQKAYEESGDCMRTMPVATGPYKVEEWVTGSSLTLVKNEDYWQTEDLRLECQMQNVDRIEYYFVTESSQIAIGLETGIYDVATSLNYTNANRFMEGGESAANFNTTTARDTYIQQIWLNRSEESPLNDLRIAQAVLYAIDQEGLINVAAEGHGYPVYCYGSDLNIGFQEKWIDEPYYPYDVDRAKELLAEAGVGEGDLNLTILCDTDEVRVKIAQLVQAYLAEIGINCEIASFEQALWNTYQTDPTQFDINISYNSVTGYITRIWNQLNSTRYAEHNMAMVRDDTLDNLLITAAITQSDEDIDAAKQYMVENAYHYGLFHKELYFITNKNKIVDAKFNIRSNFIPGASTYTWN